MSIANSETTHVSTPAEAQKGTPEAGMAQKSGGILLVVPPFQTTFTPAIGVSQLKSNLDAQAFATEILYLNLHTPSASASGSTRPSSAGHHAFSGTMSFLVCSTDTRRANSNDLFKSRSFRVS